MTDEDAMTSKEQPVGAVGELAAVVDQVAGLVESLDEREWHASTPCEDWDVRDVVDHLLDVQRRFHANLVGQPVRSRPTFRENAEMLVTAFSEDGALERVVPDRLGDITGLTLLHILTMELLAHGWDLGQAVGRPPAFEEETAARTVDFARMMSPKVPPSLRRFAAPQPVAPDAPAIVRLAALLGRKAAP
ncbi:TIGR03086 family metal-binding protein [Streptomyces fuscigenes]|uniref:TIGR03086 family metal-binding protein n=1 Tax=Streptomyces fuscigenes TaxID=1528880 RepID=UPI001F48FA3B|nr:TIGR03086 family metal-binding protein [Streptomyces fuscigenes]MCF3962628.1 TIGR03086 family metal-binding protein [Streptomyces fuscigenes]